MQTFHLPISLEIYRDEAGCIAAAERVPYPQYQPVLATVAVAYADGAFACTTGEEWVASIERAAVAAFERGETSITVE